MESIDDINYLDLGSLAFVIIGALNWGLVGLGTFAEGDWNIIDLMFGGVAGGILEALIYLAIGLAGLYQVYFGYELSR